MEPCELQLPWGKAYNVLSVNESTCMGGLVRSWTTDDKTKSITLCLEEFNSLTGEPVT